MIYLIATLKVKPNSIDTVSKLAKPSIEGTRREVGNISYDLFQSVTDANTLTFVERWQNQASLDNHFTEPHFLAWRNAGSEYILDKKLEIITPENIVEK